ncbi:MAG TPA: hypothetical protein VGO92_07210 [Acidimicrobiales bacterium]|nr:hypothetical protein [Acidimicrobiales bacterium]
MLLAELEVRHSRAIAPTRRVALGELWLPTEPAPGFGGLLLAGIVAAGVSCLDEEARDGVDRLLWDLEHGRRVAQPRLRHRFQTDVHGLDRSRHRLLGEGEALTLDIDGHGAVLPQVLGALYAAALLTQSVRPGVFRLLRRATRWQGDADEKLIRYLSNDEAAFRPWQAPGDEHWALTVLGFDRAAEPARTEILTRFRSLVREAHPDHGAITEGAGRRIHELTEARRILLAG